MSDSLYQSIVLERARNPLHAGRPAVFNAEGRSENRMCGDIISIFRGAEGWRHEARGCAILIASAELMCDVATGKTAAEIAILSGMFEKLVNTGEVNPELGDLNALASIAQYPSRLRCATLPWSALGNAIAGDAENG